MHSKVTLTFRKKELKSILQNNFKTVRRVGVAQNILKKEGHGPLGPSPKSAYAQDLTKWYSGLNLITSDYLDVFKMGYGVILLLW